MFRGSALLDPSFFPALFLLIWVQVSWLQSRCTSRIETSSPWAWSKLDRPKGWVGVNAEEKVHRCVHWTSVCSAARFTCVFAGGHLEQVFHLLLTHLSVPINCLQNPNGSRWYNGGQPSCPHFSDALFVDSLLSMTPNINGFGEIHGAPVTLRRALTISPFVSLWWNPAWRLKSFLPASPCAWSAELTGKRVRSGTDPLLDANLQSQTWPLKSPWLLASHSVKGKACAMTQEERWPAPQAQGLKLGKPPGSKNPGDWLPLSIGYFNPSHPTQQQHHGAAGTPWQVGTSFYPIWVQLCYHHSEYEWPHPWIKEKAYHSKKYLMKIYDWDCSGCPSSVKALLIRPLRVLWWRWRAFSPG